MILSLEDVWKKIPQMNLMFSFHTPNKRKWVLERLVGIYNYETHNQTHHFVFMKSSKICSHWWDCEGLFFWVAWIFTRFCNLWRPRGKGSSIERRKTSTWFIASTVDVFDETLQAWYKKRHQNENSFPFRISSCKKIFFPFLSFPTNLFSPNMSLLL